MPDNKNKDQQKQQGKKDFDDQEIVSNENEDLGNEVEDDDRITQRSPRQGDGRQGRNPQSSDSTTDRGK